MLDFNLGLFHNRLNFDVSYYNKKTTDLLLDCPVPHSTGFSTIFKNIGSVRNQGLDIMVNGTPVQGEFTWNSTVNLNFNKNEILHLGDTDADVYLYDWVGGGSILRVGESMGSFYGLVRNGIFTEEDYKAGKCEKNKSDVQTAQSLVRSLVKVYQIGLEAGSTTSLIRTLT